MMTCSTTGRHDLDKIPPSDVFKTVLLILDRLIEDEEIQARQWEG